MSVDTQQVSDEFAPDFTDGVDIPPTGDHRTETSLIDTPEAALAPVREEPASTDGVDSPPVADTPPASDGVDPAPEPVAGQPPAADPSPDTSTDPNAVEWPAELLARAGMTQERAAEHFQSPEILQNSLNLWQQQQDAQLIDEFRAKQQQPQGQGGSPPQQQQVPPVQQPAPAPQPAAQNPPVQTPSEVDIKPFEFKDADEILGPDVVPIFEEMAAHYATQAQQIHQSMSAQLAQQQEVLGGMMQQMVARHNEETTRVMDQEFNNLGPEWEPIVGKGSFEEIRGNQQFVTARQQIFADTQALAAAMEARGMPQLSPTELVQRAIAGKYHNQHQAIVQSSVQKQASEAVQARQRQITNRPSKTGSVAKSSTERAGSFANSFFQDKGIPIHVRTGDELGPGEF